MASTNVNVDIKDKDKFVDGLKKLANTIQAIPNATIQSMYLTPGVVDEDEAMFEVEYDQMTQQEIANRRDYIESAEQHQISQEGDTEVHYQAQHDGVGCIEISNSNSDPNEIDNVEKLLLRLADKVSGMQINIKDFVFHDSINNDALHQPLIRLYYTLK